MQVYPNTKHSVSSGRQECSFTNEANVCTVPAKSLHPNGDEHSTGTSTPGPDIS